jgi:positive regulator of sigma E activity
VQILATEHFVLQGARSAATMESNARSSLYLTVLSATFVALALVSQVSGTRQVLTIFAPIALSVVFFLGVATFMRVLENGVEDWTYVAGINRIRHFYIEVAPETAPYFVLSPYDDVQGVRATMGIPVRSPWQRFLTAAATISVINSLVGGVLAGAVAHAFTSSDALSFIAGALATLLSFWAFNSFERRTWRRAMDAVPIRFPSPDRQA